MSTVETQEKTAVAQASGVREVIPSAPPSGTATISEPGKAAGQGVNGYIS